MLIRVTLNPYEQWWMLVTDDGAETDLDLGHYERFLNVRRHRQIMLPQGEFTKVIWKGT